MPPIKLENVLETVKRKNLITRYALLIIALFISSLVFNVFLLPTQIVAGGTAGISIITEHLVGWDPSIVILVISSILLIVSFIFLGPEKTSGTVLSTVMYPFFVSATAPIAEVLKFDTTDMVLVAIIAGLLSGVTTGLIYKTGFSGNGLQIIGQILYKKFHLSLSKSSLLINGIVIVLGGFVFGWTMVMYAIIILYISSLISERVLIGISQNKSFFIITNKEEEVKKYIIEKLNHSVTIFDVKGAFLEKKRRVVMAVIPTKEYFHVTEGVRMIDKDVFFVVCDSYQVKGGV